MAVGHGREVIKPAEVGQVLGIRPVFGHLLMHAMNVADNRLCVINILAIHGHLDTEHPVGGWMLRSHVENKGLILLQDNRLGHALKSFKRG